MLTLLGIVVKSNGQLPLGNWHIITKNKLYKKRGASHWITFEAIGKHGFVQGEKISWTAWTWQGASLDPIGTMDSHDPKNPIVIIWSMYYYTGIKGLWPHDFIHPAFEYYIQNIFLSDRHLFVYTSRLPPSKLYRPKAIWAQLR